MANGVQNIVQDAPAVSRMNVHHTRGVEENESVLLVATYGVTIRIDQAMTSPQYYRMRQSKALRQ